ncbi:MAG: ORF6N domain-containing protein [Candidatus Omnitrophota bacterium]|jgi:hypothetical protein
MENNAPLISTETIASPIFLIRGQRVMLDSDLAQLYGVPTKALLQAVKRNIERFPADFMYLLKKQEVMNLRSQFVTSSWGGRRHPPYAFTEQGVAMISSVLKNMRAIEVNIAIMRAFVKFKEFLSSHKALARKLGELEQRIGKHDEDIRKIFFAIRQMLSQPIPPPKPKGPIGFQP